MSKRMNRIENEDMDAATHDYIGTMPCGCILGVVVDIPRSGSAATREAINDFMKSGMSITRIHHDDFKACGFGRKPDCPKHGKKEVPGLFA